MNESETAILEVETQETTAEKVWDEVNEASKELARIRREIEECKAALQKQPEKGTIFVSNHSDSLKDKIEQMKARDNEKITGRFFNRRAPGRPAKLTYNRYADDPVKWYWFEDGKVYTIPRGFADEINEYYHTPIFVKKTGELDPSDVVGENSVIAEVDRSQKKYAFVQAGY